VLRAESVLNLQGFWQPQQTQAERQNQCLEFGRALKHLPAWAVSKAFDEWVRTRTRAPSPADISIVAKRLMEPFTEEIKRRERIEAPDEPMPERLSAEDAERICQQAGFTPRRAKWVRKNRMALSLGDLDAQDENAKPDEKHIAFRQRQMDPDTPEGRALRQAREAAKRE